MKSKIIEKLNTHIRNGLEKESDVLYLLVQIGKILEQENSNNYPTLQFYRNWVVHYKLDRANQGMKNILDKLEDAAQAHQNNEETSAILKILSDTISLKKLWGEMQLFFNDHDEFDESILNKPEPWTNLGGLILGILVDLPLVAPSSYKFIKEFRFSSAVDNTHIVRIKITLQSGKFLEGPVVNGPIETSENLCQ